LDDRTLAETRFYHFMKDLDLSRATALGTLAIFWHSSQEREVAEGTMEELLKFVDAHPKEEQVRIFKAMIANDYLTDQGDGTYLIRGNKKHIEAFRRLKKNGRLGGLKSGAARASNKIPLASHVSEVGLPEDTPPARVSKPTQAAASKVEPNSIQFNSIQCNTDQFKTLKDKEEDHKKPKPPAAPPPSSAGGEAAAAHGGKASGGKSFAGRGCLLRSVQGEVRRQPTDKREGRWNSEATYEGLRSPACGKPGTSLFANVRQGIRSRLPPIGAFGVSY